MSRDQESEKMSSYKASRKMP